MNTFLWCCTYGKNSRWIDTEEWMENATKTNEVWHSKKNWTVNSFFGVKIQIEKFAIDAKYFFLCQNSNWTDSRNTKSIDFGAKIGIKKIKITEYFGAKIQIEKFTFKSFNCWRQNSNWIDFRKTKNINFGAKIEKKSKLRNIFGAKIQIFLFWDFHYWNSGISKIKFTTLQIFTEIEFWTKNETF